MMTSEGYPGDYEVGKLISGLENVKDTILSTLELKSSTIIYLLMVEELLA